MNEVQIQAWVKHVAVPEHLRRAGVSQGYAWVLFGVLDPWPDDQWVSWTSQSCGDLAGRGSPSLETDKEAPPCPVGGVSTGFVTRPEPAGFSRGLQKTHLSLTQYLSMSYPTLGTGPHASKCEHIKLFHNP